MPGRDGTGPAGMGPMTGRGMGRCTGTATAGNPRPWCGAGGHGHGHRNMYHATGLPGTLRSDRAEPDAVKVLDDKELLEQQAEFLENQLEEVKENLKRLGEKE